MRIGNLERPMSIHLFVQNYIFPSLRLKTHSRNIIFSPPLQVPTPTGVQRANVSSTSDEDNTASGGTTKTVQNQFDKNKCTSASTR